MIHIDRNTVVEPDSLRLANGAGRVETALAIVFYSKTTNTQLAFETYKAYKGKDVKRKLNALFKGKCAYCESKITVITTGDIEHFRPKGGVGKDEKKLKKPGYYWLAADWHNLLLSCPKCNRKHTLEIMGVGEKTVGKLNQFPLIKEKHRLKSHTHNMIVEESVRLLINPCIDKPEKHLLFNDNGLILAKIKNSRVSKKGLTSIDVYTLQRKELVDEREALIIRIKAQMKSVERCLRQQNKIGKGVDLEIDQWLEDEIGTLKSFLNPKAEYLAVARQYIIPFAYKALGISI